MNEAAREALQEIRSLLIGLEYHLNGDFPGALITELIERIDAAFKTPSPAETEG